MKLQHLVNEEKQPGTYEVEFNTSFRSNIKHLHGIYFYQLRAGSFVETKKMVITEVSSVVNQSHF